MGPRDAPAVHRAEAEKLAAILSEAVDGFSDAWEGWKVAAAQAHGKRATSGSWAVVRQHQELLKVLEACGPAEVATLLERAEAGAWKGLLASYSTRYSGLQHHRRRGSDYADIDRAARG